MSDIVKIDEVLTQVLEGFRAKELNIEDVSKAVTEAGDIIGIVDPLVASVLHLGMIVLLRDAAAHDPEEGIPEGYVSKVFDRGVPSG